MIRATYKTMPSLIANRVPFTHGSCHAFIEDNGNYVVYSYSTLIAGITASGAKQLNATKYSMTTSRLQNIIRKAWGI
jgi:hypothetical protein